MQVTKEIILSSVFGAGLLCAVPAWGKELASPPLQHIAEADPGGSSERNQCMSGLPAAGAMPALESIQVETSDLRADEHFFEQYLRIHPDLRVNHPQADHVRAYCYRGVLVVVRQDERHPRPTGWAQVNFIVPDLEVVRQEIEDAGSRLASAGVEPRTAPYPIRLKPDVLRNHCRVNRLELSGPEGFMIGFNQIREGTCRSPNPG